MANVNIRSNVSIQVEMSQEEIEIVKKAYWIIKAIADELWREDADETETYGNSSTACDCIYQIMKNDIGVNIDEKRWM